MSTYVSYVYILIFGIYSIGDTVLCMILGGVYVDFDFFLFSVSLTKRERKQLNIFERKVYRRILGLMFIRLVACLTTGPKPLPK